MTKATQRPREASPTHAADRGARAFSLLKKWCRRNWRDYVRNKDQTICSHVREATPSEDSKTRPSASVHSAPFFSHAHAALPPSPGQHACCPHALLSSAPWLSCGPSRPSAPSASPASALGIRPIRAGTPGGSPPPGATTRGYVGEASWIDRSQPLACGVCLPSWRLRPIAPK